MPLLRALVRVPYFILTLAVVCIYGFTIVRRNHEASSAGAEGGTNSGAGTQLAPPRSTFSSHTCSLTENLESELVGTFGTVNITCLVLMIVRSIAESKDSEQTNKFSSNTSIASIESVIFHALLAVALVGPLLATRLGGAIKVELFLLLDSSATFLCLGALFIVLRMRHVVEFRPWLLEGLFLIMAIGQVFFYQGLSATPTEEQRTFTFIGESSFGLSFLVFVYFAYLADWQETVRKYVTKQLFDFNSADNIQLVNILFCTILMAIQGILKVYHSFFTDVDAYSRYHLSSHVLILLNIPITICTISVIAKPKRLDVSVQKGLEDIIKSTANENENVASISHKFERAQKRNEELLLKMLPETVVRTMQKGESVMPQSFDNCTIYFSDIEGFSSFCSQLEPLAIFQLLNRLYSLMDFVAQLYPTLYKVETIGDAYVVCSGLPAENPHHAEHIADFTLSLRECIGLCRSPLDSSIPIRLRVGINSGNVIAGIVGSTQPHYCLFGQTMTLASRMETTGEVNKIHISASTARILEATGNYIIEERGEVQVKGTGVLRTYWLTSQSSQHPTLNTDYLRDVRMRATIIVNTIQRSLGVLKLDNIFQSSSSENSSTRIDGEDRKLGVLVVSGGSLVQDKLLRKLLEEYYQFKVTITRDVIFLHTIDDSDEIYDILVLDLDVAPIASAVMAASPVHRSKSITEAWIGSDGNHTASPIDSRISGKKIARDQPLSTSSKTDREAHSPISPAAADVDPELVRAELDYLDALQCFKGLRIGLTSSLFPQERQAHARRFDLASVLIKPLDLGVFVSIVSNHLLRT